MPKDGGKLVLEVMANLGYLLPKKDWDEFDRRFKKIFSDLDDKNTKVKGVILTSIEEYLYLKRGSICVEDLRERFQLPEYFKEECWYPTDILEGYLEKANEVMLQSPSVRSRAIGKHVLSQKALPQREYLFGKGQSSVFTAFRNITEIIDLKHYTLFKIGDCNYVIVFEGNVSQFFKEFMYGLCEGIFEMRNITYYRIELEDLRNKTKISVYFDKVEGVAM